ncbi:MAG: hypothetical protein Q9214_001806 [Letrouitia sp. 1 TL-2023]
MTKFRPCIDLHSGQVKQIVGGTLNNESAKLRVNHVSGLPASHFASLYREHGLGGAHVIMLGPGNEVAAQEALSAWPGALQIGGGITEANAKLWIDRGAEKVIVTSFLFPEARFSMSRLKGILEAVGGDKTKLVIDLSCRKSGHKWVVAMNKWQTLTDTEVNKGKVAMRSCRMHLAKEPYIETIGMLEAYCSEFLVHAADREGLQKGIDEDLVRRLGEWCNLPVTYAGGGKDTEDLNLVKDISKGKVDLTIGSALDIFGGDGVKFSECVIWNREDM